MATSISTSKPLRNAPRLATLGRSAGLPAAAPPSPPAAPAAVLDEWHPTAPAGTSDRARTDNAIGSSCGIGPAYREGGAVSKARRVKRGLAARPPSRASSRLASAHPMSSLFVFASVFAVIFVAELPDKTALTTFGLATRHKPVAVFTGASAALAVQSLAAVGAGALLGKLPARAGHVGAGVLFLVTAVLMWRQSGESEADEHDRPTKGFWRAVGVVVGVRLL